MTDNDMQPTPAWGQWVFIDPQQSTAQSPDTTAATQPVQQVTRVRALEEIPSTTGIVLDQKVLIPLILLLGAIAGIILMLILDKYMSPKHSSHHKSSQQESARQPESYQLPME